MTQDRFAGGRRPPAELGVMLALGLVSLGNYAYSAVLVWLLPPRQYAVVGAASALLLVCGTVASASMPWVLAREVARARHDPARRQAAVSFCLLGTLAEAVAGGVVTAALCLTYGDGALAAAAVGSAVAIFTSATACGYLQGLDRFGRIAVLKVLEVAVKVAAGLLLVRAGAGGAGAVAGFGIGSAVVTVVAGAALRRDLAVRLRSLADRRLWAAAGGLLAIQAGVAVLASLDVVVGSLVAPRRALATYEAAQILTRLPVFVATALSIVVFPRLVRGAAGDRERALGDVLALGARLCLPAAVVLGTLPAALVGRLFPADYGHMATVLAWTAAAGLAMGAVNLTTTAFQAAEAYRGPVLLLAAGSVALAAGAVVGVHLAGVAGLGAVATVVGSVVAGALVAAATRRWPAVRRAPWRPVVLATLAALPLIALRTRPLPWALWALAAVAAPAVAALGTLRRSVGDQAPAAATPAVPATRGLPPTDGAPASATSAPPPAAPVTPATVDRALDGAIRLELRLAAVPVTIEAG